MKSRSVSVSLFIVLFTYKLPVARRISSPVWLFPDVSAYFTKAFYHFNNQPCSRGLFSLSLSPPPPPGAMKGKRETLGKRLFKKEDDGSSACFLNAFGGKDLMDMYTIHTKTIPNDKK